MTESEAVLIGFINGSIDVFPTQLVAITESTQPLRHHFVYPGRGKIEIDFRDVENFMRKSEKPTGITMLGLENRAPFAVGHTIYGISPDHLVIGEANSVRSNLIIYLNANPSDLSAELIQEFIEETDSRSEEERSKAVLESKDSRSLKV